MAFGRLYTNVYITKLFSEVCGMANGIRFVAESPDWRRGLLWVAVPASASAWRDRHTSPERKRRGMLSRRRRRPGVGSGLA